MRNCGTQGWGGFAVREPEARSGLCYQKAARPWPSFYACMPQFACKWHYRWQRGVVMVWLQNSPSVSSVWAPVSQLTSFFCELPGPTEVCCHGGPLVSGVSSTLGPIPASWSGDRRRCHRPTYSNGHTIPADGQDPLNWATRNVSYLKLLPTSVLSQTEPQKSRTWGNVGLTCSPHELPLLQCVFPCVTWSALRVILWRKGCTTTRTSQSCFVPGSEARARPWLSGGDETPRWMFQWLLSKMIRKHIKSLAETLLPADFTMQAMKFVAEAK